MLSSASACKMNVHIRCHRNVANNCGVNAKEMALILKDMGLTGNKLTESMRVKKVGKRSCLRPCSDQVPVFGSRVWALV